jgi:hypothetical protein
MITADLCQSRISSLRISNLFRISSFGFGISDLLSNSVANRCWSEPSQIANRLGKSLVGVFSIDIAETKAPPGRYL